MEITSKEKEILETAFENEQFKEVFLKHIDNKVSTLSAKLHSSKFKDYEILHGNILSLIELKRELQEINQ